MNTTSLQPFENSLLIEKAAFTNLAAKAFVTGASNYTIKARTEFVNFLRSQFSTNIWKQVAPTLHINIWQEAIRNHLSPPLY